jgi:hypothetical protein
MSHAAMIIARQATAAGPPTVSAAGQALALARDSLDVRRIGLA